MVIQHRATISHVEKFWMKN